MVLIQCNNVSAVRLGLKELVMLALELEIIIICVLAATAYILYKS